ncbi:hypothetical protein E1292_47655, partial [Nonomuraea deserti]
MVTPADMADRDCARELLFRLRLTHPEITLVWADSAYAGSLIEWARTFLDLTVKVVSRPRGAQGFVVLAKRWVVERSLSWVLRARRHIESPRVRWRLDLLRGSSPCLVSLPTPPSCAAERCGWSPRCGRI